MSETAEAILARIRALEGSPQVDEVGSVVTVGDGVAEVLGLTKAFVSEVVEFPNDVLGIVLNLHEDGAGVVILGQDELIREGDTVKRTGRRMQVPVGPQLAGRVVDATGRPLDGRGPIKATVWRPVEARAAGVADRQPVHEPLQTGIKAVDALVPIGRGQRQLIIGDRGTGKTSLAIDAILNQKGRGVRCVYVAIGQRESAVVSLVHTLSQAGAMEYTTIVSSGAEEAPALQYLAPFSGCAIAEDVMENGGHALVVYDDLSRHAIAYRAMSLLLRRPPGREAYPGDVFYLHSRLLERSAKLSDKIGSGSMTALPIVTTLGGDISAYIPTNIISITDGQIYLDPDLFYAGVRPAINAGLSVSRVGGAAQLPPIKKVSGTLRLELAQYRELAVFSRFASELDQATRERLSRGQRLTKALTQPQFRPVAVPVQVALLYAAVHGYLDDLDLDEVSDFESQIGDVIEAEHKRLFDSLEAGEWGEQIEAEVRKVLNKVSEVFGGPQTGGDQDAAGKR